MNMKAVGVVRSPFKRREDAPRQGGEKGAKGDLVIFREYQEALEGLEGVEYLLVITWMHQADREVLKVHPRGDLHRPKRGVFSTRSPDRPNPLGFYLVRVVEFRGNVLTVEGIDAIDGTPIVDIKPFRPSLDVP